jgi:hypothetical protein
VLLGANALGQTPLTVEKVLKGTYALKLELKGYAPVSKEIMVQAAMENRENFQLEALPPVVEKKAEPVPAEAKKKKKFPLLIVAGGAALAVAAIVLLTAKKDEPQKELRSLTFNKTDVVPIDWILPTYALLEVNSVPAKIEKVDFKVTIEHPNHMEDLSVTIVAPDTHTMYNIWNRGQSPDVPTVMSGTINDFNNVGPNGTWRLLVQNPGRSPGGRIMGFLLRIYFYQ